MRIGPVYARCCTSPLPIAPALCYVDDTHACSSFTNHIPHAYSSLVNNTFFLHVPAPVALQMKKQGPNDFMFMFSYTIVIVGLLFAVLGITAMGFYLKTGVEQVCCGCMQARLAVAF